MTQQSSVLYYFLKYDMSNKHIVTFIVTLQRTVFSSLSLVHVSDRVLCSVSPKFSETVFYPYCDMLQPVLTVMVLVLLPSLKHVLSKQYRTAGVKSFNFSPLKFVAMILIRTARVDR